MFLFSQIVATVDKSFDPDVVDIAEGHRRGVKRKAGDAGLQTGPSQLFRHRQFLLRSADLTGRGMRPAPVYRAAAKRWCMNLDNGIRVGTVWPGLSLFQKSMDPRWDDWRSWPCLLVPMDLGSDGNCGIHALMYREEWRLNVIQLPDPSHAGNCCFNEALKDAGLFQVWLLFLLDWNLVFGPDDEHGRMMQLREAVQDCYTRNTPGTCALFLAFCKDIKKEREAAGVEFPGVSIEDEVWALMRARQKFAKEGSRVNMNRFMGSLHRAKDKVNLFATEGFERLYCGLEMDFLKGRRFQEKLVIKAGEKELVTEGESTTNPVRLGLEDRGIRSCAQNNVAVSCLIHADPHNKRIMQIVVTIADDLLQWHTKQNKEGRSVQAWEKWAINQIDCGFMTHVCNIFKSTQTNDGLKRMGFRSVAEMDSENLDYEFMVENDFADIAGAYCASLVKARLRRQLWMLCSWPVRMTLARKDKETAQRVIKEFKDDFEIWKETW